MSIIAYPLEATEYTAEDVQSYLSTRTSGVYSEDITFTPEGMTVTVSPFLAWFNYAKFKGCSVAVTEPETLTFSPAHAVLDRIDRIVLRLNFTVNKAYFTIIEGTPSSSPVPADISKTEAVNDISPVYVKIKAGATEITSADITSTILDESVCGIMRDGVTGIPTSELQSQVEALLIRLHDAISEVESGSAFMMGDLYDPNNKAKPVAFADETYPIDGSIPTTSETALFCKGLASLFSNANLSKLISQSQDSMDYRAVVVYKKEYLQDISKSLLFQSVENGGAKLYQIHGEHNKPSGTFTGNGNSIRNVAVGGSSKMIALFEAGQAFSEVLFVTSGGAASSVSTYNQNITFQNGVLTLKNTQQEWNAPSLVYNYISF